MKPNTKIFAIIASVVCLVSCAKEELKENEDFLNYEDVAMSFSAAFRDAGEKTVLQADGTTVFWSPNDSVKIFQGSSGSGKFVSENSEPVLTTRFNGCFRVATGTFGQAGDETFWAVYPYDAEAKYEAEAVSVRVPCTQTAVEGSFQAGAFPAIATSTNLYLAFRNVCGGIVLSVSEDDIVEIAFRGNSGEPVAGTVMVGLDQEKLPSVKEVISPESVIRLKAPAGECFKKGAKYYMAVLPVTLENGYSISFVKNDGEGRAVSNESVTVSRNTFAVVKNPDKNVKYHEFVDLGTGVKWATCNLGGESETDCGDYFAWGETQPKEFYTIGNYEFFKRDLLEIKKYNTLAEYGTVDNKTRLEPEDDAATFALGAEWRTPTYDEWKELYDNCTLSIDNVNDTLGWRATSKIDGYTDKSIFLPFRAVSQKDTVYKIYLTSEIYSKKPQSERHIHISSSTFGLDWVGLRECCSNRVRPVTSSASPEAVDLGLSVKWASKNLGASTPEQFGRTYEFGFTDADVEKDSKYVVYDSTVVKYNDIDGKTVLDPEDDAATAQYGGYWRMPTKEEFKTLLNNCEREWIDLGSTAGYKLTSKVPGYEGRFIFLRAAGRSPISNPMSCQYQTSTASDLEKGNLRYNFLIYGNNSKINVSSTRRYYGCSVRPIFDDR